GVACDELALRPARLGAPVGDASGCDDGALVVDPEPDGVRPEGTDAAHRQARSDCQQRNAGHDGDHDGAVVLRGRGRRHAGTIADIADGFVRTDLAAALVAVPLWAGIDGGMRAHAWSSASRSPARMGTVSRFSAGASGQL